MDTFEDLLDALNQLAGSDAKAAPLVGVKQSSFSQWRRRHALPEADAGVKIAELLKLDPAYVLALIQAERPGSKKTRATWHRVAERFKDAAVVAALAVGAASFGMPAPSQAGTLHSQNCVPAGAGIHIVRRRRWWHAGAA